MSLYESAKGSVVKGYFLLKKGGGNIPPNWIERERASRMGRQKKITKTLKDQDLAGVADLEEWELFYNKECFYNGIRILLELERKGKSKR